MGDKKTRTAVKSKKKSCKSGRPKKCEVVFECGINPDARSVNVVGDFNGWRLEEGVMKKGRAKKSGFKLKLKLPPGEYQYKFLVDGMWYLDPMAEKQVPNAFGTYNSVVVVREPTEP